VSSNGSTAAATWSQVELARHPDRPYALDYVHAIFGSFFELHGDRLYGDDHAIIGGPAAFDSRTVMVIAQQKGRTTAERAMRNFGMANPEGYRKALRLMKLAEKFHVPVITFIDTQGAWAGLRAVVLHPLAGRRAAVVRAAGRQEDGVGIPCPVEDVADDLLPDHEPPGLQAALLIEQQQPGAVFVGPTAKGAGWAEGCRSVAGWSQQAPCA